MTTIILAFIASIQTHEVHLSDANNFSGAIQTINNRKVESDLFWYIRNLEYRWWDQAGNEDAYNAELEYARFCHSCWSDLSVASGEVYADDIYLDYKLEKLKSLMFKIGVENYLRGTMPPMPRGLYYVIE